MAAAHFTDAPNSQAPMITCFEIVRMGLALTRHALSVTITDTGTLPDRSGGIHSRLVEDQIDQGQIVQSPLKA